MVATLDDRVGGVETQILLLRTEVRVECSAVRGERATEFAAVRREVAPDFAAVRGEMDTGVTSVKAELRQDIAALRDEMHEGFAAGRDDLLVGLATMTRELGQQMRESAEEGKRHSQVLCEEALGRIATLGEHRAESSGRQRLSRRRREVGPGPRVVPVPGQTR